MRFSDFGTSASFSSTTRLESYTAWLAGERFGGAYRRYREMLQALDDGRRFVLKAPAHSAELASLVEVFPDACVVHLHPEDARKLESVPFRSGTRIQADIGVSRGSVHVETPMGLMVRELDSALDAIAERVREELG